MYLTKKNHCIMPNANDNSSDKISAQAVAAAIFLAREGKSKQDIRKLISEVEANPDKIYLIENVGLGKKSQIGLDVIVPLFKPLKDRENVHLYQDIWDRLNTTCVTQMQM